jgi:conjugative transfer pilus assembly protein TraH
MEGRDTIKRDKTMNARYFFASIMLALAFLFSGNASAQGINDKLNEALDSMSNYTPPSVWSGARRTIVTGGSLSIKMQTGGIQAFTFKPPSISGGCGGIDAFFGAFSMISKEQLVQALRGIVTGAIQYAFKLAISVICEKCATWMADIGDLLAEANNWLSDTCNLTYNAMVSKWGDPSSRSSQMAANYRDETGNADDGADAKSQGSAISSWTRAMAAARTRLTTSQNGNAMTEANAVLGNHTWRVLKNSGSSVWTVGGTDAFFEEILSLVGTVIVCGEGEGSCPAAETTNTAKQSGEPSTRTVDSTLTLAELVAGKKTVNSAGVPNVVSILRCESSDRTKAGCLNPVPTPDPTFKPLVQRFREAFLGTGGNTGIIYKLRNAPGTAITPEEEKWLKSGGSYVGMVYKLARVDENAARGFVGDFGELVVGQMAYEMLREQYSNLRIAAGREQTAGMEQALELFYKAEERSKTDYQTFQQESEAKSSLFNAYLARVKAISQR